MLVNFKPTVGGVVRKDKKRRGGVRTSLVYAMSVAAAKCEASSGSGGSLLENAMRRNMPAPLSAAL